MKPARPPFAAAVLAGGWSVRLGTDKAFLSWQGRRLLDRQLDLLRALAPAEVILSGRRGIAYAAPDARVVFDAKPGLGPLAGLAAALAASPAPHLLVLAVDLPAMTPAFLRRLLARRQPGVGVVPRTRAGWEPLAAVYPRELLPLVRRQLRRRELALHQLIHAGMAAGLMVERRVPARTLRLFQNVNTPGDLPAAAARVPARSP